MTKHPDYISDSRKAPPLLRVRKNCLTYLSI